MKLHPKYHLFQLLALAAFCFTFALGAHAQTLVHRYRFLENGGTNFADSVTMDPNWSGTLNSQAGGNPVLSGDGLVLDGQGDFAELPAGIMSNYTQMTVEFWADVSAGNPVWTRIFAFGDQTAGGAKNSGIDYCPFAGGNYQNLDVSAPGVDAYANNNSGLDGATNVHVTVVVDSVNNQMYYYNGTAVVSIQHGNVPPFSQMNDAYSLIGRSLYDVDPTLEGTIYEFRIYNGVLPASAVALNDIAGSSNYYTNPGTITAMRFSSPLNPITINQSVQQSLYADFNLVTNLNMVLYGGVTYSSGNTNVLTVNSGGVVKGVGVGTTTVVATYGSMSATNTLTVVNVPTALVHRYSFASDASDSVGGANGTLEGDAVVTNGQLVLDGTDSTYLSLPGNLINISTNAAVTIEAWVAFGDMQDWSHLFEFGNGTAPNMIYCAPRANDGGFETFGISEDFAGGQGGQTLIWDHGWTNMTLHVTAVIDPTSSTLAFYTNGVLVTASYNATAPLTDIATNDAYLGKSSFGDPYADMSVDEFRIYNGALTPAQVAMADLSGPNSTNFNPGALSSITVPATNYPAFTAAIPPVVLANFANLSNFNLMPNVFAQENGLTVTSSDTNIISVNAQNILTTHRPGTVTLSATYLGKSASATVRVQNQAVLTHRYSFTSDASDSVGGADGTLVGTAQVSGGQVQLDGGSGDYVSLPPGLIGNYRSATIDIWATISPAQGTWSRLWEFADVGPDGGSGAKQNELYYAPLWGGGGAFMSYGVPTGGGNGGAPTPLINQTVHLTCVVGDGTVDLYTNGIRYISFGSTAPASQAGTVGSWIGYSPYGDPGITGSVDEYRIYQGRLSPEEILASDVLGPDATLSTTATLNATVSGGNTVLSWPVANAGFAVETKSSLSPSATWTTLTNAPTLVGNQWQLTVPNTGNSQFYRLVR